MNINIIRARILMPVVILAEEEEFLLIISFGSGA